MVLNCLSLGGGCFVIECMLLCVVVASLLFVASSALRVVGCVLLFLFAMCCALHCLLRLFYLANVIVVCYVWFIRCMLRCV